jgi:hypothetical protein
MPRNLRVRPILNISAATRLTTAPTASAVAAFAKAAGS